MPAAPTAETKYEPVAGWAKTPHGFWLREATSVAVDPQDRVYIFNRGNMPMLVFDPDGNLIDSWGNETPHAGMTQITDPYGVSRLVWEGVRFTWPHSVRIDPDGDLWLVDVHTHTMTKTDTAGNTLMTIGTGEPAPRQSGEPFNTPTDIAVSPANGDIFISDGYGNSRVHRYDSEGRHILSWGEPGSDPGQFSLPHNIAMVDDGHVIVCDRENHRVQVFTVDGEFVRGWHVHHAVAVVRGREEDQSLYVAEQGPPPVQRGVPNLGHRISVYTPEGELITRLGAPLPGEAPDQFLWPHSIATDSHGDVYVAEVSYVEVGSRLTPPREMVSLRKWRRVSG
ncbi:MAG: peptidyl-alpha-hydroxyglycine alpha-amidating lyase family protein [Dehalococcoidia bacterium]|nr:peptidyl-alpha-hydroxyglycine alpha-amidating lyase family protein [Dehalococcoidia bacterium]